MTRSPAINNDETTRDDARLIRAFLEGDESAFERIVKRYRQMVYFAAIKMVGNHDDADDVAQKAFISAYKNLKGFQGKSSLKTWLFRITMNYSKNLIRDRRRHVGEEVLENTATYQPDIQERLEKAEQRKSIALALKSLPPRQREVFRLRAQQDLSYAEISEVIGCSVSAAKVNYHYAVKALRAIFAPESAVMEG
jgi:RNA polymerase sigma-70 factor, ECF subfamily